MVMEHASFHILIRSLLLCGLNGGELLQGAVDVWHGRCLMPPGALGGRCLYLSRSINECRGKAGRIPKLPLGLINYPENTLKDRIWSPPIKIILLFFPLTKCLHCIQSGVTYITPSLSIPPSLSIHPPACYTTAVPANHRRMSSMG